MRLLRFLPLCLLWMPAFAFARDYLAEGEQCIAAHSGAGGVDCLKHLHQQSNADIRGLEDRIVVRSRAKERNDTITLAHHEMAASSMRDAARRFRKFSERQCDFEVGYSGAAGSGAGQVWFSCLLRLNEERLTYLHGVLAENHDGG